MGSGTVDLWLYNLSGARWTVVPEEEDANFIDEMMQKFDDPLSALMMSINLNLDC